MAGLIAPVDPRSPVFGAVINMAMQEVERRAVVEQIQTHLHYNCALLGSGISPDNHALLQDKCHGLYSEYLKHLKPWDQAEPVAVADTFKKLDSDWDSYFGPNATPEAKAEREAMLQWMREKKMKS